MQRWIGGGAAGVLAAVAIILFLPGGTTPEPSPARSATTAKIMTPSVSVKPVAYTEQGHIEAAPSRSVEQKTYAKMVADEKREAIMQGRIAYLEARMAWRRQLNAAMASARKSGDYREVKLLKAQEPLKKKYLDAE